MAVQIRRQRRPFTRGGLAAAIVAAGLLAVTTGGCSSSESNGIASGASPRATQSTTNPTASAPSFTSISPQAGSTPSVSGVPLYSRFQAEHSVGPNGKAIGADLAGTSFPNSTGMWVGCSGEEATTTYDLNGQFTRLQATAGLQLHTPDALNVRVTISGDDRELERFEAQKATTVAVDVDVNGVEALVVAAIATNPALCTVSDKPYGALGGAMLTPAAG
ncbi:NPCBM/NEW2 domain-containing protein [Mycobacterium sp. BK086]|uniref:NPCBM/NEW2 domain-containing protein n=1 Tax=Mycobacterium sp. BK086 TaxID=2512165 RepID=UPI00105C8CC5|nr:NPCBM/NEW2 domain-containing protein [Mycobacterium sp. BK086]